MPSKPFLPKILAPVGNFEMLASALQAGADEVYFGVGELNMRVGAKANFSLAEVPKIVEKCQAKRVKTNLTLNTVLFDSELEEAKKILTTAKQVGVDKVIAMDMAAIQYAFKIGLEVHASVQCGITNLESVKFYAQFCDRVVLARECDLDQQKYIIEQIHKQNILGPKGKPVEVEVFAHGALCVSISGKCGMSLLSQNQSANRGRCTQPCRRKYEVVDVESGQKFEVDNQYVMSSGDLATIGMLDRLVEMKMDVLKIEGRGKNPEYVDMTVRVYKQALEAIEKGEYNQENIKKWRNELKKVYNRKLTDGYYLGRNVKEWSGEYGSLATEKKLFVGNITHIFPKAKVLELKVLSTEFNKGDELLIISRESGVSRIQVQTLRNQQEQEITKAKKGEVVTLKIPTDLDLRNKDKVYLVVKK